MPLNNRFKGIQKSFRIETTLKVFFNTRFFSIEDVLQSIITNEQPLKQLDIDPEMSSYFKSGVKALILDADAFYPKVQTTLNLVKELCNCIRKMESDNIRLSDIVPMFKSINPSWRIMRISILASLNQDGTK